MEMVITLIVALIGGGIALRYKVPAGAVVGSMLLVALFNITTGMAYFPEEGRILAQIAAGAFIGGRIGYKDVVDMRNIIKPVIMMISGMLVLNLFMAFIMNRITGIDMVTSLFACAPGGIMDMALIGGELGADTSKVALLQIIRLISVLSIFPGLIKYITLRRSKDQDIGGNPQESENSSGKSLIESQGEKFVPTSKDNAVNFAITCFVAAVTGYAGYLSGVPAGAVTFPMISIAVLNVFWGRGYMPLTARKITQVFAGAIIGEKMGLAQLIGLKSVLAPAVVLILMFVIANLALGYIISKASKLDLTTSLFASAPGGVTDMALIAEDLGGEAPKVAVMQLARLACVIAFFPIVIKFVSTLL